MRSALILALAAAVACTTACERTFRDMYDQPRYKPLAASPLWPDGRASRPAVPGTVPRSEGTRADASAGRRGDVAAAPHVIAADTVRDDVRSQSVGDPTELAMPRFTLPLLARGRERFDIFCSPCHSIAGDGDGMVARRGFPHPPSFHTERLRAVSDAHLYAVITEGYGAMYSYATRVTPDDRLAIVAYIRALQLSQHAEVGKLGDADRDTLAALPAGVPLAR